ncbi:MAG: MMPL family transporter, partial [Planctomycetales bacterium]|nr:MMPL family transporter [Planctomycetales bacterium]
AAARDGLRATHAMTILLVLACLLLIYRSPLLVLAPLVTIFCSVAVAMGVVAMLVDLTTAGSVAGLGLRVFTTTKVFVIVILFGAGRDFCLFLIARYREELARGVAPHRAPGIALRNVSGALAGSAFTTILGLATMALAQYGKFASSGPVIAICLFIALLACTTLTPAILRIIGPAIFWPFGVSQERKHSGWEQRVWERLSDLVLRRPAWILGVGALLAAPPMMIGFTAPVNYDLLSELPSGSPSLRGARLIREHFGEGWLSPMTLAVRLPGARLDNADARFDVALLHNALFQIPEVQDVRSPYLPTGGDPTRRRHFSYEGLYNAATTGSPLTIQSFVSKAPDMAGQVMQLYLVQVSDPFSHEARDAVPRIRAALSTISHSESLDGQPNPWRGADFQLAGATAGMVDLKSITQADNHRIQIACVVAVLLVLLVLLRRPLACLYLMLTVLVTYWVTLGVTHAVFHAIYGETYHGLDWKAPLFLFVILVAVGQDYNIYLTTRVLEEQRRHGMREGLRRAIVQTGGIITSCGIIMA